MAEEKNDNDLDNILDGIDTFIYPMDPTLSYIDLKMH